MSLQDEIDEKTKEIFTDSYPMSIGELINLYQENELDIHPEFQRFFRWNMRQKTKLIESILLGIPIPAIFVSQSEKGVWDVIDGVQRLSTIFEFTGVLIDEDKVEVPPSRLEKTDYLPSLQDKVWKSDDIQNSFTQAQRIDFKRQKIGIQIIRKESDPNIKYELFNRINTLGSRLSEQEVRNCLLIMVNKDFFNWINRLAKYEPFINCVCLTEDDIKKQYHLELALRFFIFKNVDVTEITSSTYLADFITDKMKSFSIAENFDKTKEESIFKDTFSLLNDTLGEDSFIKYNLEKEKFMGKFLISTFEAVSIGIGYNIENWKSKRSDNVELTRVINERIRQLWSDSRYTRNIGSGSNFYTRIPIIVPLGKEIFVP